MEGDLLAGFNVRTLTIGDLDAIVEIDRKVLGKVRRDFWRKKIEVSNLDIPYRVWSPSMRGRSSDSLSAK